MPSTILTHIGANLCAQYKCIHAHVYIKSTAKERIATDFLVVHVTSKQTATFFFTLNAEIGFLQVRTPGPFKNN